MERTGRICRQQNLGVQETDGQTFPGGGSQSLAERETAKMEMRLTSGKRGRCLRGRCEVRAVFIPI